MADEGTDNGLDKSLPETLELARVFGGLTQIIACSRLLEFIWSDDARHFWGTVPQITAYIDSTWIRARHLVEFIDGGGDKVSLRDYAPLWRPAKTAEMKRLRSSAEKSSQQIAHVLRSPSGGNGFGATLLAHDALSVCGQIADQLDAIGHPNARWALFQVRAGQRQLEGPLSDWDPMGPSSSPPIREIRGMGPPAGGLPEPGNGSSGGGRP